MEVHVQCVSLENINILKDKQMILLQVMLYRYRWYRCKCKDKVRDRGRYRDRERGKKKNTGRDIDINILANLRPRNEIVGCWHSVEGFWQPEPE